MWLALLGLVSAQAATPTPDRPSVSRSGNLVAADTLELEVGTLMAEGGSAAPALLKYSIAGVVEPRIGANLGGIDGAPGLEAGAKVRLVTGDRFGLAAYGGSALPIEAGEGWYGDAAVLYSVGWDNNLSFQVNGGLRFVGTGSGIDLYGVPVATALGYGFTRHLSAFVEGAFTLGAGQDGVGDVILDAGLGWNLTEVLVIDGGFGYALGPNGGSPFGQLGLTANFGRVE